MTTAATKPNRVDVYTRVTNRIIEELEQGVRPWMKPWNAEHAAGRITRPLRHNGEAYKGINILMLWASAELQGFCCPIWMTFQQAKELGGFVKKGEHGSAFLCADLHITPEVREDHAAYIQNWLKALKEDKKAVFSAASYASNAVDFLHGLQPQPIV